MDIKTTTNIRVDFYDKKYILINAKQLDKSSRFLSVTCYNQGEMVSLNDGEHSAYIRYKKPDGYSVFNFCDINKGKIIVELTEQMLVSDGISYADLVIVNKGSARVNADTGEITIQDSGILSTMTFCIDVSETAVVNSEIESSYEYNGLNSTLEGYWADFEAVSRTAKSWAVGGTDTRENEDVDNAKYYCEQSLKNANSSKTSEKNAKISETNAATSESKALGYMETAERYMNRASESDISAFESMTAADESAAGAKKNMELSETYKDMAYDYSVTSQRYAVGGTNTVAGEDADNAKYYYQQSLKNADNSSKSESNALDSANIAQSYAVGGTGTRGDEDYDNAQYYYELTKNIVVGLDSGFIPMGTVSFSELANVEKATGYVYNIRDDFVTDESFREGAGRSYTAGVNVYYTANGYWDCFGGSSSPTATVDEIKNYLGIE